MIPGSFTGFAMNVSHVNIAKLAHCKPLKGMFKNHLKKDIDRKLLFTTWEFETQIRPALFWIVPKSTTSRKNLQLGIYTKWHWVKQEGSPQKKNDPCLVLRLLVILLQASWPLHEPMCSCFVKIHGSESLRNFKISENVESTWPLVGVVFRYLDEGADSGVLGILLGALWFFGGNELKILGEEG